MFCTAASSARSLRAVSSMVSGCSSSSMISYVMSGSPCSIRASAACSSSMGSSGAALDLAVIGRLDARLEPFRRFGLRGRTPSGGGSGVPSGARRAAGGGGRGVPSGARWAAGGGGSGGPFRIAGRAGGCGGSVGPSRADLPLPPARREGREGDPGGNGVPSWPLPNGRGVLPSGPTFVSKEVLAALSAATVSVALASASASVGACGSPPPGSALSLSSRFMARLRRGFVVTAPLSLSDVSVCWP
mmetsp:Transcript_5004/g.12567  ORF Transcript_5004/g.12567 Transcript_5004/m.12567 type:complete len:245 (-) Transcript_5004:775-1509(-)